MAIELAVALGVIAARTAVAQLIRGAYLSNDDWAGVAAQVVDALITTATGQRSGFQQVGQRLDQFGRQIDDLGRRIDALPAREFDNHMAAGRRYVRDFPDSWRTAQDRRELVRDARHEFVRAFGVAERMKDAHRQALADVAIAGCWLWVPSMNDVTKTVGAARRILEQEILFGAAPLAASYKDVLSLCKALGERPASTGLPVIPRSGQAPTPGARLAVTAVQGHWVGCADVEVNVEAVTAPEPPTAPRPRSTAPNPPPTRFVRRSGGGIVPSADPNSWSLGTSVPPRPAFFPRTPGQRPLASPLGRTGSGGTVKFKVRNRRAEWIAVSLTQAAVIVEVPVNGTLPAQNRVAPGKTKTFTLSRPSLTTLTLTPPSKPRVGFVLPNPARSSTPGTPPPARRQLPTPPNPTTRRPFPQNLQSPFFRFPPGDSSANR
ncbi:hypothetical protein Ssi03_67390 [Sphaerisporangium siamense]|uniref:Uncharacterized protein n=1 Tax=Sphaerisporangium siamense TaxID=795645 RepID=A0A7W7GCM8_9ACTN|nr:hypothetical protein [Sphaerisporangium siamense]MBB4704752.1 hypothetical protein [Sphaerisporangium siamense]GII88749.1 hypothetical protein Ssi03_67390 [Sphaerisporangium siamense]